MKFNINGKEVEVSDKDLTKAIEEKKETFEVKLPDITMRTADEDAVLKTNIEDNMKSTGYEIGRKDLLKGLGIEVEGAHKSTEKSIEAINTFTTVKITDAVKDAGIAPDKKVEELQKDKEALQATNLSWETKHKDLQNSLVVKDQNQSKLNLFAKHVPENSINNTENTVTIMNSMIPVGFTDSNVMFGIGLDGQPLKDQQQNLLPMDKVVSNFFDKNTSLLTKAKGGGDGGDSGGDDGGKQTLDEFVVEQQKAGNTINGAAFNAEMIEKQKAGTLET